MRQFASVLLASVVLAYAQLASAHDPGRSSYPAGATPSSPASDNSDAALLADRHLALYRASQHARDNGAASGNAAGSSNNDRGAMPAIVRTSASAALPLR